MGLELGRRGSVWWHFILYSYLGQGLVCKWRGGGNDIAFEGPQISRIISMGADG